MTVTASDANARAHARFYPCMRCGDVDLPTPLSPRLLRRLRGLEIGPGPLRGDGISLHREVAVSVDSPSPSARGTRRAVPCTHETDAADQGTLAGRLPICSGGLRLRCWRPVTCFYPRLKRFVNRYIVPCANQSSLIEGTSTGDSRSMERVRFPDGAYNLHPGGSGHRPVRRVIGLRGARCTGAGEGAPVCIR
jgi:hypothetical protein